MEKRRKTATLKDGERLSIQYPKGKILKNDLHDLRLIADFHIFEQCPEEQQHQKRKSRRK